jgi:type III restriction enzyme
MDLFNLQSNIENRVGTYNLPDYKIPDYILNNLKLDPFEWNKNAIRYFLAYNDDKYKLKTNPVHLMFNMATGTGKTLLMAAFILYYYKQGYRHFIFFVNQKNIVGKTQNNFIDKNHNKYLFTEKIIIDDNIINIKEVDTFSEYTDDIEIKFTTIHKLHNDVHLEKENQTTLEDLHKLNIVMLADEAHHLNTDTTKKGKQEELDFNEELKDNAKPDVIERKGWEHTVLELILKKNGKSIENRNVLLEFTATVPSNINVQNKYLDKTIYKFDLKAFLAKGYTKEINLVPSSFSKNERVLFALVFNWYRQKLANNYSKKNDSLSNFKPVILFRSKSIEGSEKDYELFREIVDNLNTDDFNFLNNVFDRIQKSNQQSLYENAESRTLQLKTYISENNISYSEIIDFIQYNFREQNCIITNSKSNTTQTEKTEEEQENLLNNLEDKNNHIRAIFTVKRLTEGWDVLNLFDIVRMYEEQPIGGQTNTTPAVTTEEIQLIGRGVRYYPFKYKNEIRNKRKFDNDLNNELRILEELFYYTYDERSRYIAHLKDELRKEGYINDKKVKIEFKIKEDFQDKEFLENYKLFYNEQKVNPDRKKATLEDIRKYPYEFKNIDFILAEQTKILTKKTENGKTLYVEQEKANIKLTNYNFEIGLNDAVTDNLHVWRKSLNKASTSDFGYYKYHNIKNDLEIKSLDDLLKADFLKNFKLKITTEMKTDELNPKLRFDAIDNKEKLKIFTSFLEQVKTNLESYIHPYNGTEFSKENYYSLKSLYENPKEKTIEIKKEIQDFEEKTKKWDWYLIDRFDGNTEEIALIEFIEQQIEILENKYEKVYLLRNEEVYKIYDFAEGRGFQPDFFLILKEKNEEEVFYNVFIEVKGDHLIEHDKWKEKFLLEITERYGIAEEKYLKIENQSYRLIGLPFYNSQPDLKNTFDNSYKELILE